MFSATYVQNVLFTTKMPSFQVGIPNLGIYQSQW